MSRQSDMKIEAYGTVTPPGEKPPEPEREEKSERREVRVSPHLWLMFALLAIGQMMLNALGYVTTLRNNQLDEITALVDAGAGAGTLTLYSGTRPATGGAVTTEVATLTFSDPAFPAASGGSVSASAITDDASATGGTATWFRVADSTGAAVMDGDVGTSGADLNLNSTTIAAASTVSVSSFTITAGNS